MNESPEKNTILSTVPSEKRELAGNYLLAAEYYRSNSPLIIKKIGSRSIASSFADNYERAAQAILLDHFVYSSTGAAEDHSKFDESKLMGYGLCHNFIKKLHEQDKKGDLQELKKLGQIGGRYKINLEVDPDTTKESLSNYLKAYENASRDAKASFQKKESFREDMLFDTIKSNFASSGTNYLSR